MFKFLKQGAFLTKCKMVCLKHGFEQRSAEMYIDLNREIILDCYSHKLKPEAAVGVLSGHILQNRNGQPMQLLVAAERYAHSFISKYPTESLSLQMYTALKQNQSE